jgi:hypothetical protein
MLNAVSYPRVFAIDAVNVTADNMTVFTTNNCTAVNCIFSSVSSLSGITSFTDCFTNGNSAAFQIVGAGSYYLAGSSTNRAAGTTNIDADLLADLQTLTTYPPVVVQSGWVTTNSFLSPQAPRDTNSVLDLGYHYCPLDWALNAAISNATVTISSGTAIAGYGAYGIWLWTNGIINCTGSALNPNYIVRYSTVQEQSNTNWQYSGWGGSILAPQWADNSTVNAAFTDLAVLEADFQIASSTTLIPFLVTLQNCQFNGGQIWVIGPTMLSANSLYHRVAITSRDPSIAVSNTFFNNLFLGGSLTFKHSSSGTWTFQDNLFDQTTITPLTGSTIDFCSNNAYVTTTFGFLSPENYDQILTSSPLYETGALGQYYYPTSQPHLINGGSRSATAAGLYYYTVTTNNVINGANPVSIGFHYVAVGTNGLPLDLNNDGIPDYLEYPATFSDGYGTPDSWYWMAGLNPHVPGIGGMDFDGDGLLNYQEYLYGTSPTVSEGFALWVSEPAVFSGIP